MTRGEIHVLKCEPEPFKALIAGRKQFEYRLDDRGFTEQDVLLLREWDQEGPQRYTGRVALRLVTYVLRGPDYGVPKGYVVMALLPIRFGEEA